MDLHLVRTLTWPRKAIHGELSFPIAGMRKLHTLEDPLLIKNIPVDYITAAGTTKFKVPGLTAIPEGHYRVVLTQSFRFGKILPRLLDVPNFSGILIHAGNTTEDTEGCILVGLESPRPGLVTQSRAAMSILMKELRAATEPIYITITHKEQT